MSISNVPRLHNTHYIGAGTFLSADVAIEYILMCLMELMLTAAVLNSPYSGVTVELTAHTFQ